MCKAGGRRDDAIDPLGNTAMGGDDIQRIGLGSVLCIDRQIAGHIIKRLVPTSEDSANVAATVGSVAAPPCAMV